MQTRTGCGICSNKTRERSIKGDWVEKNLHIIKEWNFEKNKDIGYPENFTKNSSKKVWWKCSKGPDHEWEATIRKRVAIMQGCPYCLGKKNFNY